MPTSAMWVSSLMKCLLKSQDHSNFLFCFLRRNLWSLTAPQVRSSPTDTCVANIFSFIVCLLALLTVSFDGWKVLNPEEKCFYQYFPFLITSFYVPFKKSLLTPRS